MMPRLQSATIKSFLAFFLLAVLNGESVTEAANRGMEPMDVARLRSVGEAAISPDGRFAAYILSVPRIPGEDDGTPWQELHVYRLPDGPSRPFITGQVNVGSLEWSGDSSAIYFLSKRHSDKTRSLYRIPVDGGEARKVLSMEVDISGFTVKGDGSKIALLAEDPVSEALKEEREKGLRATVYEEDWEFRRLFVADLGDEPPNPIQLSVAGHISRVRWSPADDRLAASIAPTPGVDDSYMSQRLHVLDGSTGRVLVMIPNPGKTGDFAWSPDGSQLALISGADIHDPSAGRLMVVAAGGGTFHNPLPELEGDVSGFGWMDEDTLLYVEERGVWNSLKSLSLSQGRQRQRMPAEGPILGSMTLDTEGSRAIMTASSPQHPAELYLHDLRNGSHRRLTNSNPWLDDLRLATQEVVQFQAADGLNLEGILIRPLDEAAGQRYPLIVVVHGGPEAHESNGWLTTYSRLGQVAAARGMAVFYPNYRGSTGRGVAFSKMSQGDPAGKEFADLVDGVDHLIAAGLVEAGRVGITGGSYGGYATAWCSTYYSSRFAAGVMFVGISNKISKVGTTDIPNEEFLVHALKRPWEDWQFFLDRSPIRHAGQSKTPLLILHGTDDPRVNVGQSRELYRHLKLRSQAPVRLVLYPGEQHGNRNAAARYDYSLRALRWFEHYLKGEGGEPPPYRIDYGLKKD